MLPTVLAVQFWHYVFGILLFACAAFLILLVMVQRGRGGGLAGAFGGMGGQSAFGTKAGDLFTRVTMVAAGLWIVLCILSVGILNSQNKPLGEADDPPTLNSADSGDGDSTDTDTDNGTGPAPAAEPGTGPAESLEPATGPATTGTPAESDDSDPDASSDDSGN